MRTSLALLVATVLLVDARFAAAQADAPPAKLEQLLRGAEEDRGAGRYAHAERAFREAAQLAKESGDAERELLALTGLGGTLVAAGQLPAANRELDAALGRAQERGASALVAAIQNERGNLLAREGRFPDALAAYDAAHELASRTGQRSLAARAATNGARAALDSPEPATPSALAARIAAALERTDAVEDARTQAVLLIHLGTSLKLLFLRTGDRPALVRAAQTFARATQVAEAAGELHSLSYAQGYLGELYESEQRFAEALELARRALAAAEAADAPGARYRWLWLEGRVQRRIGEPDAALRAYRNAVALLRNLRQGLGAGQGADAAWLLESVSPVFHECVDLLLQRAAQAQPDDAAALLGEARSTLETLKHSEVQDYFRDACVTEQREIGDLSGALVIYPVMLPDRLELITEFEGKLSRHASAIGEAQVRERVGELRRALETRTTREFIPPARDLYDWLFRPVEQALPQEASIEAVVYVPGGVLRTIPMAALQDRESGRFLIEKHPLAMTPGLTLTEPRAIGDAQVELLAAGITQSVHGFPALAGVASELDAARGVFANSSALVDQQYTAESLRAGLLAHKFGIVHIASHGEFHSDVAQSYLLTFDGRLTMDQLASMVEMTRDGDRPVELLTLSACSTAEGDERAALGLAGVAVRAGARSALATLWSVNDEAAADLIGSFYRKLGEGKLSRARALQQAQLELLGERSLRHPFYWAPFVLINSWL